jgi:hypothetical protein
VTPPRPIGDTPATGTYGRVTAWLSKRVEVALALMDLTLPQYRVWGSWPRALPPRRVWPTAWPCGHRQSPPIIDGLVARGLVDRKQEDSDRRRIALRLTDEGAHGGRGRKATVDPDSSKTWLRRAYAHRGRPQGIFITSLVLSFVGLVLQVQIPNC